MALWAPARHCCFCLQLSGATSCALWEGQTHFSRCGVTSLLLGWLCIHVLNRAGKNEHIVRVFMIFFFFAILSVPQQVSACPLIQRSTLANSVAAYYGNFMCTIHDLMQACYVNRKRLFHCTVIESYRGDVKSCWAALLHRNTNIYQQQRDAATFFFSASVSANSISLSCELIIPPFEMNELFGEQELLKTNISREPSFLFTITAPLKAIVKEFNSVNRTPSGYQNLKHFHKSWMKLLWSSPPPSPLKYNSAWNMKKGEASIRLYGSKCEEIKVDTR